MTALLLRVLESPVGAFGVGCAAVILIGCPLVWMFDRLERWAHERSTR